MDDGPDRMRRRQLFLTITQPIALMMTRAQYATFFAFWTETLNAGAQRFTATVRQPDGTGATKTCRIDGEPQEQDLGAHSRVSFTVVVES